MATFVENLPFHFLSEADFVSLIYNTQTNNLEFTSPNFSIDYVDQLLFDQFNIGQQSRMNDDLDIDFYDEYSDRVNSCKYLFDEDYDNLKSNLKPDTLSVCSWNSNSVPSNLEEFVSQVNSNGLNFDIFAFTETKLTNEIETLYNIPGYSMFTSNFQRNSGGVALYVHSNIKNIKERPDLSFKLSFLECLFIEFDLSNETYLCGVLYHRPGSNANDFIQKLNDILDLIVSENKKVILAGDFNFKIHSGPRRNL